MFTLLHHRGKSPTQSPWSTCLPSCIIVATAQTSLPGLHVHPLASSWQQQGPGSLVYIDALASTHAKPGVTFGRRSSRSIWGTNAWEGETTSRPKRRGDTHAFQWRTSMKKSYYVANFGDLYEGVTQRNIEGSDKFWNAIIGTWKTVLCQIMSK